MAGTEIESGNEGEKEKEKEVEALKIFTRLYVRPMIRITTISTIPLFSPLFFQSFRVLLIALSFSLRVKVAESGYNNQNKRLVLYFGVSTK